MAGVVITLVRLAFVATVLTVALEQIFDTNLYQKYLGKGLDGGGSRLFKHFELRPWISTAVGIFLSFGFGLKAIESGLGPEFINPTGSAGADASTIDMILTGLIIGGGTKTVYKLGKRFASAQKELQNPTGS